MTECQFASRPNFSSYVYQISNELDAKLEVCLFRDSLFRLALAVMLSFAQCSLLRNLCHFS